MCGDFDFVIKTEGSVRILLEGGKRTIRELFSGGVTQHLAFAARVILFPVIDFRRDRVVKDKHKVPTALIAAASRYECTKCFGYTRASVAAKPVGQRIVGAFALSIFCYIRAVLINHRTELCVATLQGRVAVIHAARGDGDRCADGLVTRWTRYAGARRTGT
jgi:hypothetical protein